MNASNTNTSDKYKDELRRLSDMSDEKIDTTDIPEIEGWHSAERGRFYRPGAAHNVPLYLDPDVLEFLTQRAKARGIQPHDLANEMLKKDIELVRSVEAE